MFGRPRGAVITIIKAPFINIASWAWHGRFGVRLVVELSRVILWLVKQHFIQMLSQRHPLNHTIDMIHEIASAGHKKECAIQGGVLQYGI